MRFTLDFSHHAWARDPSAAAPQHTLEVARAADAAGIDALWASEDPDGWDAFALLGALATVTRRATLGPSVTSPYPRHPNLLAASVATIDRLSDGRAVLGLGRGQVEWHRSGLGADVGEPLAVLRETIALLRAWWAEPHGATSPPGGHFRVRDWERVISPASQPPIYLAAAGPRALDLAGELCDGVIFNALTSEAALRPAIARVRESARSAGRDPDALTFILRTAIVVIDDDAHERRALDREKTILALIAPLPGMARLVQVDEFDIAAILGNVAAAMRTSEVMAAGGGFPALRRTANFAAARAAIPDALIRQLALVGALPAIQARLRALAEMGITDVGVRPPHDATSVDSWRRLLGNLGEWQGS